MPVLKSPIFHILLQILMITFFIQTLMYHRPNIQISLGLSQTKFDIFKTHPFCMCLGLMLCFNESIWLFQSVYPLPKKRWFHYALNTLGTSLATIGVSAILYKKELDGVTHFISWHGTFGIITYSHAFLQFLAGWFLLLPDLKIISKKTLKYLHRLSGCLLMTEILTVFVSSCYTSWFVSVSEYPLMPYVNILFYVIVCVVSVASVAPKILSRKKNETTKIKKVK